jgi:hypothetical protein
MMGAMPTERQARFGAGGPWNQAMPVKSEQYTCGYCDRLVASAAGYFTGGPPARIARDCPNCHGLTVFGENGATMPAPLPGQNVENLPEMVGKIYGEARAALAAGAPTAAALLFRTLLMHVACHLDAPPGKAFVDYVDFLEAGHHVPSSGKTWLDHVRKQGNVATHQLVPISDADARELLTFIDMLLRLVFDFPARVPNRLPPP